MRQLLVVATQVSESVDDEADEGVAGTYAIAVPDKVSDAKAASIALDVFHDNVSVGTLDDFEFAVLDEQRKELDQDANHKSYSGKDKGALLGRVGTALRIDLDASFVPVDGDAFDAVVSALEHFGIPSVVTIIPEGSPAFSKVSNKKGHKP